MEAFILFGISSPTAGITHHKSNLANTAQSHRKRKKHHADTKNVDKFIALRT